MQRSDPSPSRKLAYSLDEASHQLSISRRHLYDLLNEGKVRSSKLGARRVIPHSELERLLQEGAQA